MKKVGLVFLSVLIVISVLVSVPTTKGTISVEATSNIVLNGIDIGYAVGDFFTKNGKSCATSAFSNGTCHGHGICITNSDSRCNCMRYWPSKSNYQVDLMATQCMGFARYCQWKLFGFHDGNKSNKFTDITGKISTSSCTSSLLKSKLLGCQVGTHIRTGDDGHSMVVASTSSTQIKIIACNMKVDGVKSCKIYSKNYTWDEFATYLKGRSGVYYAKSTSSGSSVTPSTPSDTADPDSYSCPTRSLYYTSPTMKGDDVKWVQAVLCKLGYTVDIDGSYGKNTVSAIEKFQRDKGLSVDGKCGPATRSKLLECWNAKKAESTCKHTVVLATCTKPMHCSTCGVTAGNALGHIYTNSCDASCDRCGTSRSVTHNYNAATCTAPKTCKVCGTTSGSKLGHIYTNNADTSCNRCGKFAYPGGNTLYKEGGKWYHIVNRQKVSDTTVVKYGDTWFYVKNGVVDFNATTLCNYNGTWYYINKGKIDFNSNTLVKYNNVWYHVNGGKWVKDTTLVNYGGTWYYVKDGKMNTANTLVKYNNVWYHVNGGKWVKDTTLVKYNNAWYYVKGGKVDFSFSGKVLYSGKYYTIKNGVKV